MQPAASGAVAGVAVEEFFGSCDDDAVEPLDGFVVRPLSRAADRDWPPAARKRRPEERKDVRARSGSGLKLDGIDADADGGPAGKLDDLSE